MAGPCDTCHAGCCLSHYVFVTAHDVLRIARTAGFDAATVKAVAAPFLLTI